MEFQRSMPDNAEMRTRDALSLRYTGAAVDDGQMDVYALTAGMIAFSEYLQIASTIAYGPDAKLVTKVGSFSRGSFITQFSLDFGGILATLFSGIVSPRDLHDLVRESFQLWQFLDGEPPAKATPTEDRRVEVTNQSGGTLIVNHGTLNLVTSEAASAAAAQFAAKVLENGIESVSIDHEGAPLARSGVQQRHCFIPVAHEKPLTCNITTQWFQLESPSFKEGNKWRLSDGGSTFTAVMTDAEFMQKIDDGVVRFGKGDRLLVTMEITQKQVSRDIKTERRIIKVEDHQPAFMQQALLD